MAVESRLSLPPPLLLFLLAPRRPPRGKDSSSFRCCLLGLVHLGLQVSFISFPLGLFSLWRAKIRPNERGEGRDRNDYILGSKGRRCGQTSERVEHEPASQDGDSAWRELCALAPLLLPALCIFLFSPDISVLPFHLSWPLFSHWDYLDLEVYLKYLEDQTPLVMLWQAVYTWSTYCWQWLWLRWLWGSWGF